MSLKMLVPFVHAIAGGLTDLVANGGHLKFDGKIPPVTIGDTTVTLNSDIDVRPPADGESHYTVSTANIGLNVQTGNDTNTIAITRKGDDVTLQGYEGDEHASTIGRVVGATLNNAVQALIDKHYQSQPK